MLALSLGLILLAHPPDAPKETPVMISATGRLESARRAASESAQRAARKREAGRAIADDLERLAGEEARQKLAEEQASIEQDNRILEEKAWLEEKSAEKFRSGDLLEKKKNPTGASAIYREVIRTFRGTEAARMAEARLAALFPSYAAVKAVDGDTLVLTMDGKPRTVRLIGVDAPEILDPEKPAERLGKEASGFLDGLIKGQKVRLE